MLFWFCEFLFFVFWFYLPTNSASQENGNFYGAVDHLDFVVTELSPPAAPDGEVGLEPGEAEELALLVVDVVDHKRLQLLNLFSEFGDKVLLEVLWIGFSDLIDAPGPAILVDEIETEFHVNSVAHD